jgi:hypothetical protein
MDWNDPAARARLIARVGINEYERQQAAEFERATIERVNGYAIRLVVSSRWGGVYMVDGLGQGHSSMEGARLIARAAPPKGD